MAMGDERREAMGFADESGETGYAWHILYTVLGSNTALEVAPAYTKYHPNTK